MHVLYMFYSLLVAEDLTAEVTPAEGLGALPPPEPNLLRQLVVGELVLVQRDLVSPLQVLFYSSDEEYHFRVTYSTSRLFLKYKVKFKLIHFKGIVKSNLKVIKEIV